MEMNNKTLEEKYPLTSKLVYNKSVEIQNGLARRCTPIHYTLEEFYLKELNSLTSPLIDMLEELLRNPDELIYKFNLGMGEYKHKSSGLCVSRTFLSTKPTYPDFVTTSKEGSYIDTIIKLIIEDRNEVRVNKAREEYINAFCRKI